MSSTEVVVKGEAIESDDDEEVTYETKKTVVSKIL